MLKSIVEKISNEFINEAISSPNLLADMAAMERYMAESYSGRIFIELVQNADDCGSTRICIKQVGNAIICANDGRVFNEEDLIAISRSGASNKERGTSIGYRGIGFKSTTYLTDEIIIYSDDVYFTFSKKLCSKRVNIDIDKIPMIRIPILLENVDTVIKDTVLDLKKIGYKTIFIFKNAKVTEFLEEMKVVNNGYFIFLNNIEECYIEFKMLQKNFKIRREHLEDGDLIKFINEENNAWYIRKYKEVAVGFKYDIKNNKIVACSNEENVYHSYLPTFDKLEFPIKVNADFSTDPSRKHITFDFKTEEAISDIASIIVKIINESFNKEKKLIIKNYLLFLVKVEFFLDATAY